MRNIEDALEKSLTLAITSFVLSSEEKDEDGVSTILYLKRPYVHSMNGNLGVIEAIYVSNDEFDLEFRLDCLGERFFITPDLPMLQYVVRELEIPTNDFDNIIQNIISRRYK